MTSNTINNNTTVDTTNKRKRTSGGGTVEWHELLQKVEANLLVQVDRHTQQGPTPTTQSSGESETATATTTTAVVLSLEAHVVRHGVDILDTKLSLLLSFLIDYTVYHKRQQQRRHNSTTTKSQQQSQQQQYHRLSTLKVALDKLLSTLERPLQYQLDKLLAAAAGADGSTEWDDDNPLHFRPARARPEPGDYNSDDDDDDDCEEEEETESKNDDMDHDDDDLAAARRTLAKHREKSSRATNKEDEGTGIYRPPRLSATPYPHSQKGRPEEEGPDFSNLDQNHRPSRRGMDDDDDDDNDLDNNSNINDKARRRMEQQKQRLRASEVAQALRATYSDAPDAEDTMGGARHSLHPTNHNSNNNKLSQRQKDRTSFEEDHMIRLTVSRAEKKERQRAVRQETGNNLHAMTDMGNLAREAAGVRGNRRPNNTQNARPYTNDRSQSRRR